MKLLLFFICLTISLFSLQIKVKDQILDVEVADTEKLRQAGLQNRSKLKKSSGMLFIFPEPINVSFWMKDTYLDLSIGFFDKNRKLTQIEKMPSFKTGKSLRIYQSKNPIKYALEVNMGWFENNGIKIGDVLYF